MCFGPRGGVICVINADGSQRQQLTDPNQDLNGGGSPSWSPDGRQIAFESIRDSQRIPGASFAIYVMDADGRNPVRLTDSLAFVSTEPDWQL